MPSVRDRGGALALSTVLLLTGLAGCGGPRRGPAPSGLSVPAGSGAPPGPAPSAPTVQAGAAVATTGPPSTGAQPAGGAPAATATPATGATPAPVAGDGAAKSTTAPVSPVPLATAAAPVVPVRPPFVGTVSAPGPADLISTYRPGCPVGPAQLRVLHLSYWGFDNRAHVGSMVVNVAVTGQVLQVFATLYAEGFPIRQMEPEDAFGGQDPVSMAADNTSGFNCRNAVTPGPPQWSVHAYGEAIDVNPVENPYLEGGASQPAAGAAYLNRSLHRPGMAYPGGQLVAAFASVGWSWGGRWTASPDYQHFSLTGG